jgi:protein O-GlcNAc transferase
MVASPILLLQQALTLHHAGRLEEAEAAYRRVLEADPRYGDAWHYLGVLLAQRGDQLGAVAAIGKALAADDKGALAHFHLAESLRMLGRNEAALASYDRAIALGPDFPPAHDARAWVLTELDRFEEALEASAKVLSLAPDRPEGYFRRGNALLGLGDNEAALEAFDRALALDPDGVIALNGRGCALQALGRREEAVQAFHNAAVVKPDFFEAFENLGKILSELGRHEEALGAYGRALALNPRAAETGFNFAVSLMELNRLEGAAGAFDKTLSVDPNNGLAAALGLYMRAQLCDWSSHAARVADLKRRVAEGQICVIFPLLVAFDDPALHLKAARAAVLAGMQRAAVAARATEMTLPAGKQRAPVPARAHARLRIAYLSADFHEHPVSHQIVELLERHDRARFEIFGVCLKDGPDSAKRRRLKAGFEHFLEAGKRTDADTARLLAEAGIDIAVDLNGLTNSCRPKIFALRPAPVAVNYLGYPGTMGAVHIDYILADGVVIPPGSEAFYSEQVARLPTCYMPSDGAERDGALPTRQEEGLPQEGLVFCAFNNAYKLTPEIFDVWMGLLKEVDGSVLWLNLHNPKVQGNLRAEAARRGVEPARLIFAERKEARGEHLARLGLADLFLDTFPYGAHSTASDMLWAGVPVVTLIGQSFASRVAASLLTTAGTPELIATDLAGYETLALALARAPERLAALRQKLKRDAASRFDMTALCRAVETAYGTMWHRHEKGLPPEAFTIAP